MKHFKYALMSTVAAVGISTASPSAAFWFGPVCIPTLQNCSCKFIYPCPTTDAGALLEAKEKIDTLKEQLQTLKDIKNPQEMLMMSLRGNGSLQIPGMSSIGIDLNSLISGDLSSLGLPKGVDINMIQNLAEGDITPGTFMSLATAAGVNTEQLTAAGLSPAVLDAIVERRISPQALLGVAGAMGITPEIAALSDNLSSIGLDRDMIGAVASGKLAPQYLVELASNAGITSDQLDGIGLSMSNLQALADGSMPTPEVLSLSRNLGLQSNVLSNIGIDEELLQSIAQGSEHVAKIEELAGSAGLSAFDLASVGLDAETLSQLDAGMSPSGVMSLLQRTGFDQSPLTSLGIDAGLVGQIASGELPPETINLLAANAGLNPSAIVIPGAKGPVSAPADPNAPVQEQKFMTIPASSVPGLENVLKQVRNPSATVAAPEKGTGTQADAPMCDIETMTLISTDISPNAYGDDLANIDMAISGGALETFEESITAVDEANVGTAVFGFARSVTTQSIVVKAMESVDAFEQMLENTTSLQDDYAVSDTINAHLMAARAESASLMTALVSMKAAQDLNGDVMSPIPLFPQNSRFEEVVDEKLEAKRKENLEKARELKKVSQDHSQFIRQARQTTKNYNAVTNAISVAESMPEVEAIIWDHESLKSMQVSLEEVIISRLNQLYDDPAAAWEILRKELYQEAGSYLDTERYEEGFRDASRISLELTATRTSTSYGKRKYSVHEDRDGDREWHYGRATETPYAYDFIDPSGAPLGDPYVRGDHGIKPRSVLLREDNDDDTYMPYGYEMVGALQYYLEIVRRTQFYSELRRGDATASMSNSFWRELITNASQCIIGPIQLNEANLISRPDMFDLSPDCKHLTWSLGDAGDYISGAELGGADAALWISKITLDRTQQRTGGPDKVLKDMQAVIDYAKKHNLLDRMKSQSLSDSFTQTNGVLDILESALGDGSFSKEINFPRLNR